MSIGIPSGQELNESAIWKIETGSDDELDTLIDEAYRNGSVLYEWAGKVSKLTVEMLEVEIYQ